MEAGDDSCPINTNHVKGCSKWITLYKNKVADDALNKFYKKNYTKNKKNK